LNLDFGIPDTASTALAFMEIVATLGISFEDPVGQSVFVSFFQVGRVYISGIVLSFHAHQLYLMPLIRAIKKISKKYI